MRAGFLSQLVIHECHFQLSVINPDISGVSTIGSHTTITDISKMCGRFCIAASPGEPMKRNQVDVPSEYTPRYNVAPGQKVLTITWTETQVSEALRCGGYPPGWLTG
ncbi:MAG: SOS response-associated peptidase family protein [Methanobacteriota archaeon]